MEARGGCLCGAVRYRAAGPLRPVIACHCRQCRRTHGHYAAYTAAARAGFVLEDEAALGWYESSPGIRRGFCRVCGASLFWEKQGSGRIGISAGSLDPPTGLRLEGHIHLRSAGDYYTVEDRLPGFAGASGGRLEGDASLDGEAEEGSS